MHRVRGLAWDRACSTPLHRKDTDGGGEGIDAVHNNGAAYRLSKDCLLKEVHPEAYGHIG